MKLDQDLLDILVCPETHQPVAVAGSEVLARVNAAVDKGRAATRGGETVEEPVEEGLLREDGQVLYPVREGIPIMLVDESLDLSAL